MNFNEKIVLVTGASGGIGSSIALKFSKYKAKLALVGRNEVKLRNVADQCKAHTTSPLIIAADLSDNKDVKRVIETTINHFGKLDILINNAGMFERANIFSENLMMILDDSMAINFRAIVHLTHLAVPYLIETKGNIVNVSSLSSNTVIVSSSLCYCASKAALDQFTRSAALDLGNKGVRVNSVNPGPVKTNCLDVANIHKEEQEKYWDTFKKGSVLDKLVESDEVADVVMFLASDMAKSVTGTSFVIDNGVFLKGYSNI